MRRSRHQPRSSDPRPGLEEALDPSGSGSSALDNPVAAGGWLVMALTGFLIVANATLFQSARHPAPLVATREAPQPVASEAPVVEPSPAELERQRLVRDVQVELRRLGLYEGTLDGLKGPATERGVRAYQRTRGLPETGLVDTALLARLAMDTGGTTAEPSGPPIPPRAPEATGAASAPVPPAPVAGTQGGATASVQRDARLARVQKALADLGYGPIDIDGLMGSQTASAIRRFELDRGMAITGEADAELEREIERVLGRPLPR
ncbi:peptidoglycan-binding domain-containing protein [Stappia sp.]|uniref:peptidoglycan-binding domain-containing protein n=1 Tax=Stappia sp. TaxID=1870903 RepID=UPI0032D8CE80